MLSRLAGAILRAILVAFLVALPSMMIPGTTGDTALMASFLATCLGALIFVEYNAAAPSFVEFLDAPPFNRIRFFALYFMVLGLALIVRGEVAPNTLTRSVEAVGMWFGRLFDFPYSPVRLMGLTMPAQSDPSAHRMVMACAGLVLAVSLITMAGFAAVIRVTGWPTSRRNFNLWTNLPNFEPQSRSDILERLQRDVSFNLAMGFLLPFIVPAVLVALGPDLSPLQPGSRQALVWVIATWGALPVSLVMRGIALLIVARTIEEQRVSLQAEIMTPAQI